MAGGNLTLSGGSILNGNTYVGGTSGITSATTATAVQSGASPVNFTSVSSTLTQTSTALAALSSTTSAEQKWGGIYISGSGSSVEVSVVPEPSSVAMLLAGLALIGLIGRRRQQGEQPAAAH